MFSSCRRQNEGDERLALKRHLMVNMTNLRAKAKPVEREMSYSHMVAQVETVRICLKVALSINSIHTNYMSLDHFAILWLCLGWTGQCI